MKRKVAPTGDAQSPLGRAKKKRKMLKDDEEQAKDGSSKSDAERTPAPYAVAHFKVDLKDPNTVFAGVEKFVELCRSFAAEEKAIGGSTGGYDLASEYCRSSPDCRELLRLLDEADKRSDSEVQLIYEALECILLRLASVDSRAAPHWHSTAARSVVEAVLGGGGGGGGAEGDSTGGAGGCLKRIYSSLSMARKSAHIKAALRLLTAVVVQGDWAAKEFDLRFDLEHSHVLPLFNRRDSKDANDVRACLLQLIVAVLLHSPPAVLRHVMERRNLFAALFAAIHTDTSSAVQMLLSTLLDEVVLNPLLTKTVKIRVFTESALRHLFTLYHWKGPAAWKSAIAGRSGRRLRHTGASAKAENDAAADDALADADEDLVDADELWAVRAAVHRLLITLCCDLKLGINFHDKSLGTSGRNMNHVLGGLLQAAARRQQVLAASAPLPTAGGSGSAASASAGAAAVASEEQDKDESGRWDSEADLIDELVTSVLRTCPDQLHSYLGKMEQSFVPRLSTAWLRHVGFLTKLYSTLPSPVTVLTSASEMTIGAAKRVAAASVLLLPPAAVLQHFHAAIKRPEIVVRHAALRLLAVLLWRADSTLQALTAVHSSRGVTGCAAGGGGGGDGGGDVDSELTLLLREALVLRLPDFRAVSACWALVLEFTNDASSTDAFGTDLGVAIAIVDYAAAVLEAVEGYQAVLPSVVAEFPPDVAGLLRGVAIVKAGGSGGSAAGSQTVGVRLLRLLGRMKDFGVSALRERGRDQKTALHWLLLLVTGLPAGDAELRAESVTLLSQLIGRTGMFDGLDFELSVWLGCAFRHASAACGAADQVDVASMVPTPVVDYLEKCLLVLISNPYPYLEAVCQYASAEGYDLSRGLPFSPLVVVAVRTALQQHQQQPEGQKADSEATVGGLRSADSAGAATAYLRDTLLHIMSAQDDPRPLVAFYEQEAVAVCCPRTKHYCLLLKSRFGRSEAFSARKEVALGSSKSKARHPVPKRKQQQQQLNDDFAEHVWSVFFDGDDPQAGDGAEGEGKEAGLTSLLLGRGSVVDGVSGGMRQQQQQQQRLVLYMRHVLLGLSWALQSSFDDGCTSGVVEHGFRLVRLIMRQELEQLAATTAAGESGEMTRPRPTESEQLSAVGHGGVAAADKGNLTVGVSGFLSGAEDGELLGDVMASDEVLQVAAATRTADDGLGSSRGAHRTTEAGGSAWAAHAGTAVTAFLRSSLVRTWFPLPPAGARRGRDASAVAAVTEAIASLISFYGEAVVVDGDLRVAEDVGAELVAAIERSAENVSDPSLLLSCARAAASVLRRADVGSGVAGRLVQTARAVAAADATTVDAEHGYYTCVRALVAAVTRGLSADSVVADASMQRLLELTTARLADDVGGPDETAPAAAETAGRGGCQDPGPLHVAALEYVSWLTERLPAHPLPDAVVLSALKTVSTADAESEPARLAAVVLARLLVRSQSHLAAFGGWLKSVRQLNKAAVVQLSPVAAAYLSVCRHHHSLAQQEALADSAALRKLDKVYWSVGVKKLLSGRSVAGSILDVLCSLCHLLRTDEERVRLCAQLSAAAAGAADNEAVAACRALWSLYTTAAKLFTDSSARRQYLADVVAEWDSVVACGLSKEVSRSVCSLLRDAGGSSGATKPADNDVKPVPVVDSSFVGAIDSSWKAFVTGVLKSCYEEPDVMRMLSALIAKLYAAAGRRGDGNARPLQQQAEPADGKVSDHSDPGATPVGRVAPPSPPKSLSAIQLFGMFTGHSKFLAVVLTEPSARHPCGDAVLDALLWLLLADGSAARQEHFALWLGAYDASLSSTDQRLLCLMQLYEGLGVATDKYRPFIWGMQAMERHRRDAAAGRDSVAGSGPGAAAARRLLNSDSPTKQLLQCLDADRMRRSALGFPLRRVLRPRPADGFPGASELGALTVDCYDPAFILPLLSYVFRPDQLVDSRAAVLGRLLGYALAALASHLPDVRLAAGHVLLSYRHHLEPARFAEKRQILRLLACTQDSLESAGKKLSCVFTTYLVKMADALLKPDQHVYGPLCKFMHLRPTFDILNVPEFYKLFNSADMEFKVERMWMLRLLEEGLRETADYRIYEKRYVFKLLLAFHDSPLSDAASKAQVLAIVKRAVGLRSVALDLVRQHGLVAWLATTAGMASTVELRTSVLDILQCLWSAIAPTTAQENGDCLVDGEPQEQRPPPPAWFVAEMAVAAKMADNLVKGWPMMGSGRQDLPVASSPAACHRRFFWVTEATQQHELLLKQLADEGHFVQPSIKLS